MSAPQVSDTIHALKKAASNPPEDVEEKRKLYKAARQLMLSTETPHETTQRIYYGGLSLILADVGVDLGLFKILLASPERTFAIAELSEMVEAEPLLLQRVMRGLVAHGLVAESAEGAYRANDVTKLLANDAVAAGVKHNHLHVNPALQCIPEFLQKTQYRNPDDSKNLPFQMGHGTDQTTFEWLSHRPENLKWTIRFMSSQRASQKSWIDNPGLFPTKDFTLQSKEDDSERVLMVDVGGGAGHQCLALCKAHPELKGRVVLQDLPGTIAMADQEMLRGLKIEPQGHDFMTPQPVKAAKVYYMRNILHDWPHATCLAILKQLRDAMAPDSVVIIDEIVVQNSESTWKQVNYDFIMMAALGGMERTRAQWQAMLSEAKLELREVIGYDGETGDSILIAGPVP